MLLDDHAAVFEQAELIVKVKEPQPVEVSLLRPARFSSLICISQRIKR